MKRAVRFIVILALLMVVQGAWAQTTGTLSHEGHKMKFSISGVKITDKGEVNYQGPVYDRTDGDLLVEMKGTVKKGATVKAEAIKVSGVDMPRIGIFFYPSKPGQMNILGWQDLSDRNFPKVTSNSGTFTVPDDVDWLRVVILYQTPKKGRRIHLDISLKVEDETPPTRWEPPSYSNCEHPDSHCRFEELWGEVSFRCNDQYDDSYESAEYQTVIKQEDRIQTKEESGAKVWVPDWDTYVNLKEETTVIIRVEEQRIPTVIEMVAGSIWGNIKKMAEGKSIECEMSHCIMGSGEFDLTEEQWRIAKKYRIHPSQFGSIEHQLMDEPHAIPASYVLDPYNSPTFNNIGYTADDDDIVFACEIKNGAGTAYVFRGEMTLRNKNDKTYKLKAGQAGTLARDGKITVKKFDANKIAKKFGITNAALLGNITSPTLPSHNSTEMTKRYGVERAIVKYKVTKGSEEGVMAKVFDSYGSLERRELKMGNQTTILINDRMVCYILDPKKRTAKITDYGELNFLDFNSPQMQKLKLQEKGKRIFLDKECTIYANSNTEYYVWKGVVLKKVERTSNGTTTTEATSVELPASVDAKYFKLPAGYTVK
jgi:hypothetical protein